MKKYKMLPIIIMLILLSLFVGSYLTFAQSIADSITETIFDWNQKIGSWKTSYYISLSSVVIIGVLGAIAGLLQRTSKPWLTNLAMVCAFSVTIITVVKEQIDLRDHKEINKSIIEAEELVSKIQNWKGKALVKKDDIDYQMVILDEVLKLTSELYEVQMKISYISNSNFHLISTAYAASDWTKLNSMKVTKDGWVNIIGIGQGDDLGGAREASNSSIQNQIEAYIQNSIGEKIQQGTKSKSKKSSAIKRVEARKEKIAESFLKNLKVKETKFDSEKSGKYTFYSWYQVTEKHLENFINLYSAFFTK